MVKKELNEKLNHISFHTPGHNGGVFGNWSKYDVTELSYSDNLLFSDGIIADLEARYAKLYQTDCAFLFTNGATGAVFATVFAQQAKIVVLGAAHASVFRAIRAFQKSAVWCRDTKALEDYLLQCQANNDQQPSALFFTAPDYLGMLPNLAEIKRIAAKYQLKTICDASHGSHFIFSNKLPVSATKYADLVIHSLHKTLPVLTGGAGVFCSKTDADSILYARANTHTTSPSYLTLASMEQPLALCKTAEQSYAEVLELLEYFTKDIHKNTTFKRLPTDDPTRLVIAANNARAVQTCLEQNDIYCEYADQTHLIFIVTPYNKNALAYLAQVLQQAEVATQTVQTAVANDVGLVKNTTIAQDQMPLVAHQNDPYARCDIAYKELCVTPQAVEKVALKDAVGKTLAAEVGLYPPGVPLFFAGHVLSKSDVDILKFCTETLFGLADGCLFVVK